MAYSPELVEMVVKQHLRDPDLARFGSIKAYSDRKLNSKQVTVACGSVNAKNAFGGYTGSKDFVLVADTLQLFMDSELNNANFVRLWNGLCAGVHGAPTSKQR